MTNISSASIQCFVQNKQDRDQLSDKDGCSAMTQTLKVCLPSGDEKTPWSNERGTSQAVKCPQGTIHLDARVSAVHCDHVCDQ